MSAASPPLEALRTLYAAIPDAIGADSCAGWFAVRAPEPRTGASAGEPWFDYGPRFDELWAALRGANALDDAEYMRWPALADYNEGRRRLSDAPRGDLAKWLFAVYRQERFLTGLWAGELARGRLKEAIARLIALDSKGV